MKNLYGFFDSHSFFITNDAFDNTAKPLTGSQCFLFGHCFTEDDILKDQRLSEQEFEYLKANHSKLSGLFVCINITNGEVEILVDPLVQYPVFYLKESGRFAISNSLALLAERYYIGPDYTFLTDYMIYHGPLRGATPAASLKTVLFDDLQEGSAFSIDRENLKIVKTNLLHQNNMNYWEALRELAKNIKQRAEIISRKYNYIECALSGGIDCRIVACAFKSYPNVYYYSFGTNSQDRLCFEALTKQFNLNRANKVKYVGRGSRTSEERVRMLNDLNCIKLLHHGAYLNYDEPFEADGCSLSGYFGEYIGHKLPAANISKLDGSVRKEPHIDMMPQWALAVESEYTAPFWQRYGQATKFGESKRQINQQLYLNHRGLSHFGMHSVADNRCVDSFNILYDPIALRVSEQSPYQEWQEDNGVTCLDLMIELGELELALFPYESRRISRYRDFEQVPEPNCFDGFTFPVEDLEAIPRGYHPSPNLDRWKMDGFDDLVNPVDFLRSEKFSDFFEKFPEFSYLKKTYDDTSLHQHQEILCHFLLANSFLNKLHFGAGVK